MTPNIIELSEKTVIGIKSSMHHNQFEKIVELWKRFIPKRVLIKNTVNTAFIALQEYSDFNNMETSFKIWACVEVTDLNIIPEGKKYKNGIIDSEEDFYVPIRLKM